MDNFLQKILMYLIAILLLFIYPIYTAFEKKDDISHMIVSKATHVLVDKVRSKGYISNDMLAQYNEIINLTGNFYDVKMEIKSKRYDPVVNIYECVKNSNGHNEVILKDIVAEEKYEEKYKGVYENNKKYIDIKTRAYKSNLDSISVSNGNLAPLEGLDYVLSAVHTSKIQYENYTEKQIIPAIKSDDPNANLKFYMNKGDNFAMKVKNENITTSTVFYGVFTSRKSEYLNPRIYIHYGGVIRNETNEIIVPQVNVK